LEQEEALSPSRNAIIRGKCGDPRRWTGDFPVTVCIAVRSYSGVFLISDRMITSGDIQFEPPAEKINFLTSSIAVMASGDSAFHNEIMKDVTKDVGERVRKAPDDWWLVKDVVDLYVKHRNEAKLKRAEAAVLAPLGLDRITFIEKQKIMDGEIIASISRDLINFEVPDIAVIIAGLDNLMGDRSTNTHIYSIFNDYISCDDSVGFRAIGSGSRHAESHLMLTRHSWNTDVHVTILSGYCAKKNAEIAPGVGAHTDMFMIGPDLGSNDRIRPEIVLKLDEEYKKLKKKQAKAQKDSQEELKRYVNSLPSNTKQTSQADKPSGEAPKTTGSDSEQTEPDKH
jgi:ATP-dependent protease HslVU (ClpYQ) peptidase subunit